MDKLTLPDVSRLSFIEKADKVYSVTGAKPKLLDHVYVLDAVVDNNRLTEGKLMQGVPSVIDGTSSKANLIDWAANMAVDYVKEHTLDNENAYGEFGIYGEKHVIARPENLATILENARKAHTRRKEAAGTKGTDAHALVEAYINMCIGRGGMAHMPSTVIPSLIAPFVQWSIENHVEFISAEQRLYSETNVLGGTCDFVALIDGKLTIGDLKTYPKMWSADAFIQMGAYSLMWHELTGKRPVQSIVVKMCDPLDERLKKYNCKSFATYPRYALQEDEEMFLKRLDVYGYNQAFTSPKE